jgi:hypothetical protein
VTKLSDIEGPGSAYSDKCKEAGIGPVEKLLEIYCVKKNRKATSDTTGINEKLIPECVNRADLSGVKGRQHTIC